MQNMTSVGGAIETMNKELALLRQSNMHFPISFDDQKPPRQPHHALKEKTMASHDTKIDKSESNHNTKISIEKQSFVQAEPEEEIQLKEEPKQVPKLNLACIEAARTNFKLDPSSVSKQNSQEKMIAPSPLNQTANKIVTRKQTTSTIDMPYDKFITMNKLQSVAEMQKMGSDSVEE
jgi:hypothetical protein